MTTQEQLANRCVDVAELAKSAVEWIVDEDNAELVGLQRKSLVRMLRKSTRRAQKLARSARTKMSVSVFGPSQAGKSFLVSVLARPAGGRLVSDFPGPGGRMDYISEINPVGEGESTGLVTRFTMTREPCPEGFPIKLVLLSEADVARTLINSFYMDGDQSEVPPEPAEITQHLDTFRGKCGADVPGMSFEEVLEIAEYVNGTFGRTAFSASLRPFWDEAASIAPGLSVRDRAAFYEILWGGHKELTGLYVQLAEALGKIQNAEMVHVGLDALTPRESSIIDVKTLHGLNGDGGGDLLALRLPSGMTASLPRAVVCALAAELVMPMVDQPSDIFAETDLLDFPGARNRFEQPLKVTLSKPDKLPELLLRGKVAYLFDRYVENQEITSMLLCVPDSNMETLDLPGLVDNWIALTHGTTPAQRAQTNCILFFVMTKFDKHLGDSASGGEEELRFDRRVKASLLEKFGRGTDAWVKEWSPGKPFQNCYWLRNPNYFVEGLIDYDADMQELGIKPEKAERIAELKAGCLVAPNVQRHFSNPDIAWEAALKTNDGGVGYLIEQLTKVCKPDSKIKQITAQLDRLVNDVRGEIGRFHISDDIEQRIQEKRKAAGELIDGLEAAFRRHRFGAFLSALMVDQDTLRDRIARVPSSVRISRAVSAAVAAPVPGASPGAPAALARPGAGLLRPGAAPAPAVADSVPVDTAVTPEIRTMTLEAFQAETSVEVWIEGLKRFRDDVDTLRSFGLTEESVANASAELSHAVRRSGVVDAIQDQLRAMNFGLTVDKQAEPASIVCAERINKFVTALGTESMVDKDKPSVPLPDGSARIVFEPRHHSETADDLPALGRPAAEEFWTDWVFALDAMFEANARDTGNGKINIEQNLRIGKIIRGLDGEEPRP
ncbi:virulence factor SrfC family protein [Devosia sp. Root635]|uniref:virulence factor SrfC family protein n=1 Tax=Devosia sp. Root635 TaxID=1736575 RepID=UPI0006F2C87D|nr:virulence factor SrfC family protein [Devosia sp. Root635]KRA52997.1 hypothetical protein ASD80_14455 [Devosia sp. Root635]